MWFDVPRDVLIVLLWIFLKERVFIWLQSDCEINWILLSLLFSLKSRFSNHPMITNKFLHLVLHHFLQSKIWIQKDSGDAWSCLHIFCWNKWNMCLSIFHPFEDIWNTFYKSGNLCSVSYRQRQWRWEQWKTKLVRDFFAAAREGKWYGFSSHKGENVGEVQHLLKSRPVLSQN